MHIIVTLKERLEDMPPILSAIMLLNDLGHKVSVICENVPEYWQQYYKSNRINYYVADSYVGRGASSVKKVKSYLIYRNFSKSIISKIYSGDSILWIEGPQTIVAIGSSFIKKFEYVLMIEELHQNSKLHLKVIDKVIRDAKAVFMPEYNRTILYKVWFNLEKRPYTLPNKPYFLPTQDVLELAEKKYYDILAPLNNKKFILYQGVIDGVRRLDNFILAAKQLGDDYMFVLLGPGRGNSVHELKSLWDNVYHIDFLPAPDYLTITARAYMGIVSYVPNTLNNCYCAPNKMYEYGAFGVPMIGNDIPGLKLIEHQNAGVTTEDTNIEAIVNAYKTIIRNHDDYSINARKLYDSTDNKETIRIALANI